MDTEYTFNWKCEERDKIEPCEYITKKRKYSIIPINHESFIKEKKNEKKQKDVEIQEKKDFPLKNNNNKIMVSHDKTIANIKTIPLYIIPFLHLMFNILVLCILSYAIISFSSYFKNDLKIRVEDERKKNEFIISEAQRNYLDNNCNNCVPALKDMCHKWKTEMDMDVDRVKVLPIISSIVGEVLSSVVDNISYKGFILGIALMVVYLKYSKNNIK